jgi:hypothetical protein
MFILRLHRLVPAATTDDHGTAAQFRIAQELDGRVERIHVQVGDKTRWRHGTKFVGEGRLA